MITLSMGSLISIILSCLFIAYVFVLQSYIIDLREKVVRMALEVDRSKEEVRLALEQNEKRNAEIYQSLSSLAALTSFFSVPLSSPKVEAGKPTKEVTKEAPILSIFKDKKEEE